MTLTVLRAISLENHMIKKAPYEGRKRQVTRKRGKCGHDRVFSSLEKFKNTTVMIKCSLTEFGRVRWEDIWLSVRTHGPRAIYFPFPPSHSVSKNILRIWCFAVLSFPNLWLFEKKRSCIRKPSFSGGWVTVFCLCASVFLQSGWRWNLFDYGWWSKCIERSATGRKGGKTFEQLNFC